MAQGTFNSQTDPLIGFDTSPALTGGTKDSVYDTHPASIAIVTTANPITSSATLANVPGLSLNVLGINNDNTTFATYVFRAVLAVTSNGSGGIKVAIGGTATATSVTYTAWSYGGTVLEAVNTATSLGTAVGGSTTAVTNVIIEGSIVTATPGTLTVEAAQNASFATPTTVNLLSSFQVQRVS